MSVKDKLKYLEQSKKETRSTPAGRNEHNLLERNRISDGRNSTKNMHQEALENQPFPPKRIQTDYVFEKKQMTSFES